MHNPESVLENETHKVCLEFWDTNESTNHDQKIRESNSQQKKRVISKESEKRYKYLDLARE